MGLWTTLKSIFLPEDRTTVSLEDAELLEWLGIDRNNTKAVQEVTYFTCLKKLSETMGKLPLHYYQQTDRGTIRAEPTSMARLLTIRPNDYMTPTTLWTTTEMMRQHYGNAFIYIDQELKRSRYGGTIEYKGLYPMHPKDVTIWIDNAGIFGESGRLKYQYINPSNGEEYFFDSEEVMHFKTWYSLDGVTGEPVRRILADTINGAIASQDVMANLYKNGMTASMVMQYTVDIDDNRREKLRKRFAEGLTGPKAAGKVIPIPDGLKLQPLDVKLTDAQFYELKKYSALQIAAAFGITPNQINDYEKSSYSNSEMQQLVFLVETMQHAIKGYEEEINAKTLDPAQQDAEFFYRFNEKAILRTDSKTQMDAIVEAVNNAVYTPNEARSFLQLPAMEGGDILMCNGNYIPVTAVAEKGGEDGST